MNEPPAAMGRVTVKVSLDLIREALKVPSSLSIRQITMEDNDFPDGLCTVVLRGPALPRDLGEVSPIITRHRERIVWKFGDVEIE